MIFPQRWKRMCSMPVSLGASRKENILPLRHAPDLALENAQLRWVHLVISGINGQQWRFDTLEARRGIIISRSLPVVKHIVGVGVHGPAFQPLEFEIGFNSRPRGLMQMGRAAG